MPNKNCPQCGETLTCNATQDQPCWCAGYPAIMPISAEAECLCRDCLTRAIGRRIAEMITSRSHQSMLEYAGRYRSDGDLIEHIDYTLEAGNYVFSAWYHLKRGTCCGNGCRNCPYGSNVSV